MIMPRRLMLAARTAASRFVHPGSRRRSRARLPAWSRLALRWKLRGKRRALALSMESAVGLRFTNTSHTHWHVDGHQRKWPQRVNSLSPAIISAIRTVRSMMEWRLRVDCIVRLAAERLGARHRSRYEDELNSANKKVSSSAVPITLLARRSQGFPFLTKEPNNLSTIVDLQIRNTSAEGTREQPFSLWTRVFRLARVTLARQAMQPEPPALAELRQVSAKFATFTHRSEYQWGAGQTSERGEKRRNPRKADRENLPTALGMPSHRSFTETAILVSGHVPGLSSRWAQSKRIPTKVETGSNNWRGGTAFRRNKTATAILPNHKPGVVWRGGRSKKFQTKLATSRDEKRAAANFRRGGMEAATRLISDEPPDLVWPAPHANKLQTSIDIDNSDASGRTARSAPPDGRMKAALQEKAYGEKVSAFGGTTALDPGLVDRLVDDVIRRIERQMRIERERCGL
jgi:hypothetical protein